MNQRQSLNVRQRRWVAVSAAWSLALCVTPLTHTLGFEAAFASALLVSVSAAHEGVAQLNANAQVSPQASVWRVWWSALRGATLPALIPLALIGLNALRVGSCDVLEGLLYYLLLPGVTWLVASGWGIASAVLRQRLGFSGGMRLYLLGYFISVVWALWQVWSTPIIDPFHALLGYYPGAIYDEQLSQVGRLAWSRLEDISWVVSALALLASARMFTLSLACAFSVSWVGAAHFDLKRSTAQIQARLGGRLEAERFVMYYPKHWSSEHVEPLRLELTYLYDELEDFFGKSLSRRAEAYFYESSHQKKRLMGAGRTRVAKPWQYALHVDSPYVGMSTLKHELAHVLSAELVPAPHHLSLYRGWLPHMPLIEGLAEAATWDEGHLTPHQLSAALRREGLAPPLTELLNPGGFYLSSSRLAYTMCGSFVRFYREQEGIEAMNALYASGGAELMGARLERVVEAWAQRVDALTLGQQEQRFMAQMLNRPSIFYKVCAHEVAEVSSRAYQAEGRGAWEEALSAWREIKGFSEGDREAQLGEIKALYRLGRFDELKALLKALGTPQDTPLALRLREWSLDLLWREPLTAERLTALEQGYSALLNDHPMRAPRRRLAVKLACVKEVGREGKQSRGARLALLLIAPPSPPAQSYAEVLHELWRGEREGWGVMAYLKARSEGDESTSLKLFEKALTLGLPFAELRYEAERLSAHLTFTLALRGERAHYTKAAQMFEALSTTHKFDLTTAEREKLAGWARRALSFKQHSTPLPASPSLPPPQEETIKAP